MWQTHSASKYLAICLFANSVHGQLTDGQYQCKLRMIPLSIFGNVEMIQEKYSSVPVNEVVLNIPRISHQRRIGTFIERHNTKTRQFDINN